jgi:hypothetical protein
MLREEERPVTFRAALASPTIFNTNGRTPEGLLHLEFSRSCSFDPNELRRLSVATDPRRTLIGISQDKHFAGGLKLYGLINTGTRWLRDVRGGSLAGPVLPPIPVVHVEAPGFIEVYKGYEPVGKLRTGKLYGERLDLFDSVWLSDSFGNSRSACSSNTHSPDVKLRQTENPGLTCTRCSPARLPCV